MHSKTKSAILCLAALMLSGLPDGRAQDPRSPAERAKELMDQTRQALGGEAALKAIRSLSGSGTFIIGVGEHRASGQLKLDLLLPDMFMRTMKWSPMPTVQVTTTEAVESAKVWTDSKTGQNGSIELGGMGGGMGRGGSRRSGGGGGRGGEGGGGPAPEMRENAGAPQFKEQMLADLDCMLLALFFSAPDIPPEGFTYAGEMDVDNVRADSLKITAGNGVTFTMALDQKTHRPFMVEYHMSPPAGSAPMRRRNSDDPNHPAEAVSRQMDIQIYLSDYRPLQEKQIGQVWLPYQINKSSDGQPVEDFRIESFKLNPASKPEQFKEKR